MCELATVVGFESPRAYQDVLISVHHIFVSMTTKTHERAVKSLVPGNP